MKLKTTAISILSILFAGLAYATPAKPNIVVILCDDLGYGDVQVLNPEHGKIKTPSIDKLASDGIIFTDAHSGSSVCTPTRYGLLTGRYSWRTHLQRGVVQGFDPNLIAEDRMSVAGFLKTQGYHTSIIGKWHLDFQYANAQTGDILNRNAVKKGKAPVGSIIPDGPLTRGFDYYHGFHHAGDMEVIIENDKVIEHDEVINMLPRLTRKAVEYIDSRAADKDTPFFLYVPYGSPHTPIVPSPEWQGRSGLGDYADFVMQTDAGVGEISAALEKHGFTENTLIIFSSDNGCSKAANIPELLEKGHKVSAQYRGSKADLWDGGHRVPFIARWPKSIKAGTTSDQTICLVDLFATTSDIVKQQAPAGTAEDSVSFLPALSGQPISSTRAGVIHHSISGHFSYRKGKWKLLLAAGSGGWTSPKESEMPKGSTKGQLYDMEADPAEATNLYENQPEIVAELLALLTADVNRGRSTEGPESLNDTKGIKLWKTSPEGKKKKSEGKKKKSKAKK